MADRKRIAIIGAGISGLVLARELIAKADVTVFEKARGVGGRMSTRYADPFYFDHGAQFFTARSVKFNSFLHPFIEKGIVAEWKGKVIALEADKKETKHMWFEPHWVASPNMNSLCKALAEGLDIKTSCEVLPLPEFTQPWNLSDKVGNALGEFDWVISTAPPAQTLKLFAPYIQADSPLHTTRLLGCYTLMLGFNQPWDRQWIAASVRENPIQWISVNSSKPGRNNNVTSLVVHTANPWAEEHIDDDMDEAQAFLLNQFVMLTGIDVARADYITSHRWRYATVSNPENASPFLDTTRGIAACSDWCSASRIEDVWTHAMKLASEIGQSL